MALSEKETVVRKSRFSEEKMVRILRSADRTPIDEFTGELDAYTRWYNESRIKISLGSRSPANLWDLASKDSLNKVPCRAANGLLFAQR